MKIFGKAPLVTETSQAATFSRRAFLVSAGQVGVAAMLVVVCDLATSAGPTERLISASTSNCFLNFLKSISMSFAV